MKIEVKEECQECGGTGLLRNPFYQDLDVFIKSYRDEKGERPTVEEEDEWLRQQGYEEWPKEEFRCHVCDGAGEISRWIDIKELAKIIKEMPC